MNTLAREQLLVDPLSAVGALTPEKPFCDRHIGGCTYRVNINGRAYTGRGNTEREAAWALLASIAQRQQQLESCL